MDMGKLTTFAIAKEEAMKRGMEGVGFAHTKAGGIVTLDFDHCVVDGVVRKDVLDLVTMTYAEFSPSGNGIHAAFFGDPHLLHNYKAAADGEAFAVEAFNSAGFTTFTGWVLDHVHELGYEDHIVKLPQEVVDACNARFNARSTSQTVFDPDDFMAGHEPKLSLTVAEMEHLLADLDPSMGRDPWLRVGMALKHETDDDDTGFELWDEWSSRGDTYPGTEALRYQWDSLTGGAGKRQVTMRSVIKMAKDAGYRIGRLSGHPEVSCQFKLLDRAAIMSQPPLRWRVKNLFPETGVGAVYGPSGSGKSFLGFDLGLSIALGQPWFGHRTTACDVTYVILEGEAGLRNRAQAWEAHNGAIIPCGFMAMAQPFQLADQAQVEELGQLLPEGGVVLIDTLNRAAPGMDENSSQDMGDLLAGMKRLQEITCGLVLVVHHTGKDASKGLRGHSSLFAALDGAIEVERGADHRCWSAAKVKDGEDGKQMPFKLNVVELGIDAEGDPITSCAVGPDAEALTKPPAITGKHQKRAFNCVTDLVNSSQFIGKAGTASDIKCITFEAALYEVAHSLVGVEQKRRLPSARTALQGLIERGHFQSRLDAEQVEWLWL